MITRRGREKLTFKKGAEKANSLKRVGKTEFKKGRE